MNVQVFPNDFDETLSDEEREILRAIRSLRFGTVEVVIHDGRITLVERREKTKFAEPGGKSKP